MTREKEQINTMVEAEMDFNDPLLGWFERVKKQYRAGEIASGDQIVSPFGIHGTEESQDEFGDTYLLIGFVLVDDVYPEIDDNTYGTLQGFRIYKEEG